MAADAVGFFLVCPCGVQVFVPERALTQFEAPAATFAVSCPMCGEELYRFTQTRQVCAPVGDPDAVPASLEVQQYHAKQGKRWETP